MARTPRSKPASSGPGRGTPRSRTAARPGERSASRKSRPKPVETTTPSSAPSANPAPVPARNRAVGITWRLLVLGVVVAVIAVSLAQSLRVYFNQAQQIAELREEIVARNAEIEDLQDQIDRWDDPDYVKKMARERLGWVMPGEIGYRVIGHDGETLGGEDDVLAAGEEMGDLWWQKMWGSVALADQPMGDEASESGETLPEPSPTPESTR